ncbi:hypothetical protein WR25_04029 isoform B [Diploscapter pachys]|nr:hypothetical protein WR25_04029 isoform B [Diploscapter pachys]
MVVMMAAADQLRREDPSLADQIGLLFVVGEEVDHVGMTKANEFNVSPEYLIVGEPTEMKFASIQKGAMKVKLKARGVAGHSGYLTSGYSAVHILVNVLKDVLDYKWPESQKTGATTVNIGKIEGGQALNAWAEYAEAGLFFRVTTSIDDITQKLEAIVKGRVEVDVWNFNEPVLLDEPPIKTEMDPVSFNTDLPFWHGLEKLKGRYLFGCGSIKNAHSKDEHMPRNELKECPSVLIKLMKELLK